MTSQANLPETCLSSGKSQVNLPENGQKWPIEDDLVHFFLKSERICLRKGLKRAGKVPSRKSAILMGQKKILSPKPKGFRLRIQKSRLTGWNGFLLPKIERYNNRSRTCTVRGWMNNILNPKSYCIDILVIANMISRAWISSELGCIAFFAGSTTKVFVWRLAWNPVQRRTLVSFKWYWHVAEAIFGEPEPVP